MNRRHFLGILGASGVPLTGCIARVQSPGVGGTPTESCPSEPDISVSNRRNESYSVTVTVTKAPDENGGRTVYERTFELAPDTHESEDDAVFTNTGKYRVTAVLETGESDSATITITDDNLEFVRQWAGFTAELRSDGTVGLSGYHADPSMEAQKKAEEC